jgi:ribonuclease P protein component
MKRISTLKKNYEFKNVLSKGKFYIGNQVIIYILKNKFNENRLGIALSSKLCNAVKRNRIKRVIRACYQENIKNTNLGHDIVIIWNKKADVSDLSYKIIHEDMRKIFLNSGIKII